MAKKQIGNFQQFEHDVSDRPLWLVGEDIPDSFLDEEISFGETAGQSFYLSDLANMWCDVAFVKALMKHPEAILPLKEIARRFNIKVRPVYLKDFFHVLGVTDQFFWENNLDTVEDLLTKVRIDHVMLSDLVKNDLESAFRSVYGCSLSLTA